jgi:molybdopterin synthase catalytic subunit
LAGSIAFARNHEFAGLEEALGDGDEVALMPPVSGGSDSPWVASETGPDGSFFALTNDSIDSRALAGRLLQGGDGAVITFEGVVRDHTGNRQTLYLDYECYPPLALKKMREIGCGVLARHAVNRIAIVHRLGRLRISESSIAIVVTSAHRRPAYEASLEAINRVKKLVPIWKKEHFEDGSMWVEGEWEDSVPRSARIVS